jgi:fatty-acyl-CoA synthase
MLLNTKMTMSDALSASVEARPDLEVFICGQTRLTNRQLLANVDALARGLAGLGIRKGDRVVALLPPGPEFVYLFFAAAALGAVVVPLNPELRERGLRDVLGDAEPIALAAEHPPDDATLRQFAGLRHVITTGRQQRGISLAGLMAPGQAASPPGQAAPPPGQATPPPGQAVPPPPAVSSDDLLALMYTSGTTGRPKATMHTHGGLIAPIVASVKVRELWLRPSSLRTVVEVTKAVARYRGRLLRSIGRPQTFLAAAGWHTITGLHVMLQGLLMGDRLVAMPQFQPKEMLRIVEQERVTILVGVPTAYQALLGLPDFSQYDTSSLLVCGCGGAPCPLSLAREIQRSFHCAFYNGFGMTEAAGGIAVSGLADSDQQQIETVGRPMPGVDIRIVDEQRHDVPSGEVGELAVRGEGVMLGYYQAPEATAKVKDREGWLYTGDLARIDRKGYVRIVGRSKDVIIRGGQNIYPAEIESYLASHPKIGEAAVVGVPSAVGGESVWAFVRLKHNVQMTVREVLDFCRGTLETYKIPSQVRFVPELPKAEMGKYQKYKLRAAAMAELRPPEQGAAVPADS